jgi:hypothetical protein
MHRLTKTDFIQFLNCPNSLWLLKNKPDLYNTYKGEFSLFLEKLIREGYEVEEYVARLYPQAVDLEHCTSEEVVNHLKIPGWYTQATLATDSGLYARMDMIEVTSSNTLTIYEIKSSTSVKTDKKHNHLKDICFQQFVAEENGYVVSAVQHVHLNKEFVKAGDINPAELLQIEDVTEAVSAIYAQTKEEIKAALEHINRSEINESLCTCIDTTRANHCDTFLYFNQSIPEHPIYELNNIRDAKIQVLRGGNVVSIGEISADFKLSPYQTLQKQSVDRGAAIIDHQAIAEALSDLAFPLYFFDYETLPFAVPRVSGYKPHQHTPVQYSLHILHEDDSLVHHEYLADNLEPPEKLIQSMQEHIGTTGTLVSWYASFEKTRNREMAELYPAYEPFLTNLNDRTYDLMDIFKKDYVDARFEGSQSIKKVQPVLVPDLSYKALEVQSGTMAVDAAERLYEMTDESEIAELREAMLQYCKLDTLAMVKIYQNLRDL